MGYTGYTPLKLKGRTLKKPLNKVPFFCNFVTRAAGAKSWIRIEGLCHQIGYTTYTPLKLEGPTLIFFAI